MRWLEHRVPPPVIGILCGACMWFVARASGHVEMPLVILVVVALALFTTGVAFMVSGAYAFRRAGTTVNPLTPEASSSLVTGGVYRLSRNPMYVGVATLLLAWAVYLAAPLALLGPLLFVAYITRFQIIPEERALSDKFGTEFLAYCQAVRRWI